MNNNLAFRSAAEYSLRDLSSLFARAFEGYFVTVTDDPVSFASRLRADHTDLAASLVLLKDSAEVGLALICRRGEQSRVGGMGLIAVGRGQGLGRVLMERVIQEARERQDRAILLEVIEQNLSALHLYQSCGFEVRGRLLGYQATGQAGEKAPLQQMSISEFAQLVQADAGSLPWQLQPASLSAATWPSRAYRLGQAAALLTEVGKTVHLRAVYVPPEERLQGQGRRLMRALFAQFPERQFVIPALIPEGLAHAFLLKVGFSPSELSQFEMVLPL